MIAAKVSLQKIYYMITINCRVLGGTSLERVKLQMHESANLQSRFGVEG